MVKEVPATTVLLVTLRNYAVYPKRKMKDTASKETVHRYSPFERIKSKLITILI